MALIAVIEDDAAVRSFIVRIVRAESHTVVEAADGPSAIELCSQQAVDLLVCDILLPGKSGPEVFEACKAKHPDLRVVFTSGYTREQLSSKHAPPENSLFLHKPFTPAELCDAINEALMA